VKRLFIAIDVDDETRHEIGRISSNLRDRWNPRSRISWVRPDRMHLTLHFFGQADEMLERRLLTALAEPSREPAFHLSFEGLGFFPARGSPRVLWLGIRDGLVELRRLQKVLAERILVGRDLSRALPARPLTRQPPDTDRPFSPHLTLGRLRDRTPRTELKEITGIQASAGPCLIDRVTLYESRLSPAGPTYVQLAEMALIS
jgi:RNA 2',3'-cyclic 3'-phosphodiesterase